MPNASKVAIATPDKATLGARPQGIGGSGQTRGYFSRANDPIHLHLHTLSRGETMEFTPAAVDRLAYLWEGEVNAGGRGLRPGSSLIVEHGASLRVRGVAETSHLVAFGAGREPEAPRAGGHVHLLPSDAVPHVPPRADTDARGALHANGQCPGCKVWLNENWLSGMAEAPQGAQASRGIHAHPADEIIFVTGGRIRLGSRLYEKGTALAIAADTLYGFSPGPEGLSFITFRVSDDDRIRFASGGAFMASDYFKCIESLPYLEPLDA